MLSSAIAALVNCHHTNLSAAKKRRMRAARTDFFLRKNKEPTKPGLLLSDLCFGCALPSFRFLYLATKLKRKLPSKMRRRAFGLSRCRRPKTSALYLFTGASAWLKRMGSNFKYSQSATALGFWRKDFTRNNSCVRTTRGSGARCYPFTLLIQDDLNA